MESTANGAVISMPSAVVAVLVAFSVGAIVGHAIGRSTAAEGEEIALRGGDEPKAQPASQKEGEGEGVTRYRIEVNNQMPQKGPPDALVTIVMWSDFQCPFCKRVEPTLSRILEEYGNRVRIVWRDQPLPFHPMAMPAAEAAREAFAQGGNAKFWKMHELIFEHQQELSRETLDRLAQQVGLDMERYRRAMDNHVHQAAIRADSEAGNKVGANGTPTFFINGRELAGAQPFEEFKRVIDEEINHANRLLRNGVPRSRLYETIVKDGRTEAAPPPEAQRPQPRPQPDPKAIYKVPVGNSPQLGPSDALVTMVIFSDFECPFCARVEGTIKQLREQYGNDLRVVWKNNPLPFHQNAMPAAEAAMEVYAQRGNEAFWKYHDLLFENQRELSRETLERLAQQIPGINMNRFRQALDDHRHRSSIEADQQLARQLGATGTPSFFINGRNLRGAQPIENFKQLIDEVLEQAKERVRNGTPKARLYEEIIANGATQPVMLPPSEPAEDPNANRVFDIPVPANAPVKGLANAPVTIQIFSDYQCPFCARVESTLKELFNRYQGRIRLVWRDYPLPFHTNAMPAAIAAREVYRQKGNDAFWRYHDLLFENQQNLSRETLERLAEQIGGIDMARFRKALDTNAHEPLIKADMDAANRTGVGIGTPTFFINGRLLQGAQPVDAFAAVIDRALAEKK
ncbi:MAG: thioredoxin domain-containing protein [Sandaracinaceae bacterium]|nr:thioredoxin domain-containing protein [Sandaracinaceae bacterium]